MKQLPCRNGKGKTKENIMATKATKNESTLVSPNSSEAQSMTRSQAVVVFDPLSSVKGISLTGGAMLKPDSKIDGKGVLREKATVHLPTIADLKAKPENSMLSHDGLVALQERAGKELFPAASEIIGKARETGNYIVGRISTTYSGGIGIALKPIKTNDIATLIDRACKANGRSREANAKALGVTDPKPTTIELVTAGV